MDAKRDSRVALGWRILDGALAVRRKIRLAVPTSARSHILLIPAVLLVSILAVGLVDLLWKSFHSYDSFRGIQGPFSLEQYRRLRSPELSQYFSSVIIRTTAMSVVVTITAVAASVPLAYAIVRARHETWRSLALILILLPFLMGEVVRTFGWLLLLGPQGALGWLSHLFGQSPPRMIGSLQAIWIGSIQVMLPIATLIMLPAVRKIHPDLERAAQIMGARPRRVWLHVVAPLVRPGVLGASVAVFALSMTEFAVPEILGARRRPFVANAIHNVYFFQYNIYLGSALAMLLVGLVTVAVIIMVALGTRPLRRRTVPEQAAS